MNSVDNTTTATGFPASPYPWPYSPWISLKPGKGKSRASGPVNEAIMTFVLKGRIAISLGCNSRIVNAGEFFMIPPGTPYSGECLESGKLIACSFGMEIMMNETFAINDLLPLCQEQKSDLTVLPFGELLQSYLALLEVYIREKINAETFIEMKKQEFFYLLFSLYNKNDLARFFHPIINRDVQFKNFVMTNWMKAKNVKELAKLSDYSASGFIKKFNRYFNESPYRWILRQKAEHIHQEISLGMVPLKEIAKKYHFSSYQHFSDFCRIYYGVGPKELIRKQKEQKSRSRT